VSALLAAPRPPHAGARQTRRLPVAPNPRCMRSTSKHFELQAFPDLTDEFVEMSLKLEGPFRGDPSLVLEEGAEDEEEEEPPADDEEEGGAPAKPKRVRFSESHRLAHRVGAIDADVSVVPRGAYMVTATHHVVRNPSFAGLSATEAASPASYLHFRKPFALERKGTLEKEGLVKDTDFLDPIAEDSPAGVWSVRVNHAEGLATCRSLKWPGYYFVHRLGSQVFGGVYFGDGSKNLDLAFML
jgi:radial spoke head protein 9